MNKVRNSDGMDWIEKLGGIMSVLPEKEFPIRNLYLLECTICLEYWIHVAKRQKASQRSKVSYFW